MIIIIIIIIMIRIMIIMMMMIFVVIFISILLICLMLIISINGINNTPASGFSDARGGDQPLSSRLRFISACRPASKAPTSASQSSTAVSSRDARARGPRSPWQPTSRRRSASSEAMCFRASLALGRLRKQPGGQDAAGAACPACPAGPAGPRRGGAALPMIMIITC